MIAIELSLSQLKDAVKQLSPSEKLELNDVLWNDDTIIPIEHQVLVRERIKLAEQTPERMLDWEEASKTLHY